jgi:hypothetical protein
MNEYVGLRGKAWFRALSGQDKPQTGDPGSVLSANANIGPEAALYLCVAPNPESRFPCVRDGQVGLEEAYMIGVGRPTSLRVSLSSNFCSMLVKLCAVSMENS